MQLEEIKISVTAETKSAILSLKQLSEALKTLDKLGSKGTNLQKVNAELMSFAKSISSLSDKTISNISRLADAFSKLSYIKMDSSAASRIAELSAQLDTTPENGLAGSFEQAGRAIESAVPSFDMGEEVVRGLDDAVEQASVAVTEETQALAQNATAEQDDANATHANTSAKKQTTEATKRETTETNRNTQAKTRATSASHNYSGALGRLASAFKRILLYRAIRSLIRGFTSALGDGIKNLYAYSTALNSVDGSNFANTMNSIKSMTTQLKNSLATVVAPVINAILPLLQKLAGYAIQAANAIARFFAFLNGQSTYTVAKEVAVQWDDVGSAVDGTGGAVDDLDDSLGKANASAKELKRTILGFDELNVLDAPSGGGGGSSGGGGGSSGGGGGGGGGGATVSASDMFEEAEVGQLTGVWAKLAEWAQTLIKDAKIIWGWVKKIFDKLYETGVFDIIIGLIDSIVTTIDELITELDETGVFDDIAQAIADILTAVTQIWESDVVQSLVKSVLAHAVQIVSEGLQVTAEALQTISSLLNGDGEGAIQHFVNSLLGSAKLIVRVAFGIWDVIVGIVNGIFTLVMNGIAALIDAIPGLGTLLGTSGDEIRNEAKNLLKDINTFFDDSEQHALDSISHVELGWNILWEGGADDAEKFYAATVNMTEQELDRIYQLYIEGKTKIEDNKIMIDADGDGYYEEILNIESAADDIKIDPVEIDGDTTEIDQDLIDIGHKNSLMYENFKNNPYPIDGNTKNIDDDLNKTDKGYNKLRDNIVRSPVKFGAIDNITPTADKSLKNYKALKFPTKDLTANNKVNAVTDKAQKYWVDKKFGAKALTGENKIGTAVASAYQTWANRIFPSKGLKGENKIAPAVNSAYNTWTGKTFYAKGLSATYGGVTTAVNSAQTYWSRASFPDKTLGAQVKLKVPSGLQIERFAEGGIIDAGQVFVAREAGPELVGTMGNRTAVANNDQIISGIANGVASAMSSQNVLLAQQNNLLTQILAKEGNVTVSTSSIINGLNRTNRRAGKPVVAMG